MTTWWRKGVLAFGLFGVLAACGSDVANQDTIESTSTTTSATTTTTTTTTTPPSTVAAVVIPQIAPGEMHIEPPGPYVDGQQITLYAGTEHFIDLYNSAPRVCAAIDRGDEVCGDVWLRPRPLRNPPAGTDGVTVDLSQRHFGPAGPADCGSESVECRIYWRTEAGELLTSSVLAFEGELAESVTITAQLTGEPGVVRIDTTSIDFNESIDGLPPRLLDEIAETIDEFGEFDPDLLEIEWSVGSVCGYGPTGPPIGSEDLVDPPSWWNFQDESETEPKHFWGPVCDWQALDGSLDDIGADGILELGLRRNIYGYDGWVDCAIGSCYINIGWSWVHPEPGGGAMLGSEGGSVRVAVDVPDTWPADRPTISIAEPGPYSSGQSVQVVATGVDGESIGIGWCPGGEGHCSWRFATVMDGVASVEWTIAGTAESCGLDHCYFAIDSQAEGMAPPAIVIVPLV